MKKTLTITVLFLIINNFVFAQQNKTIHQEQFEKYSSYKFSSEAQWDSLNNYKKGDYKYKNRTTNRGLHKEVFGWNPYWMGTSYYDYDYSLLSEVSYFSYVVDAHTGNYNDIYYWKTTEIIDYAHAAGCRVSLTATLFSEHDILFENPTSVQTLIDSLISLVQYRDADGINIDFESVSSSQKDNLTQFMINLSNQLQVAIPNAKLSIALPAVDWNNTFDVAAMNNYVDLFLIMGYEYHWSGGGTTGPGAPKNNGEIWYERDVTRSINSYLERGASPEKLCLAVPYYSRDWATEDNSVPGTPVENGVAVIYKNVREDYSDYTQQFDLHSSTPYYIYEDATNWHQCWHNDEISLGFKYDMINIKNIAGIGIWALGYDGGYSELYDIISEKFTTEGNQLCEGTFTDMGGPMGNYFDDEEYTYTISPQSAEQIKIIFDEFHVEADYDTLFIYDGETTNAPLINFYTGEHFIQDDTLIANSGAMTFRFYSDGATTREGWNARWSCDDFSNSIQNTSGNINKINILPNPFIDNALINISLQEPETVEIKIYSITGLVISEKLLFLQNGNHNISVNSFSPLLTKGTYIVRIIIGDEIFYKKIIKL